MDKFKKTLAAFLAVIMVSFFAGATLTVDANPKPAIDAKVESAEKHLKTESENDLNANEEEITLPENRSPYYEFFTGTVKSIENLQGIENLAYRRQHVLVENSSGVQVNFVISNETLFVDDAKIKTGTVITGFYKANAPTIMIFPPQYFADIVAINTDGRNIRADIFDKNLVSANNSLKLNVADTTQVVLPDGQPFKGNLANKKLIVIYGATTKSIPAQTTPSKIIVILQDKDNQTIGDVSQMNIIVNGTAVAVSPSYLNENGSIMVNLEPIATAIGQTVTIDDKQVVKYGSDVSFTAGENEYTYKEDTIIELESASALTDGKIYVPLKFFTKVAHLPSAYVSEGQIIINSVEKKK